MASITTAQSGPSNVGSTWTGGVVPGTTFAGTRTTTAAGFAIGATTIALQAGSPAVTAGKWIKFAGHSTYHRVTTGLGTGAGNIVLTQGLEEAIPASATTINVDMVDDKVTIAHPGTNIGSASQYRLNGAASAGATTIPVNSGAGTIVAGECVQFEHPVGTDEDGQPIYDSTYYPVTTGITGAGSLVISLPLSYAMASGVRVMDRGHVVELVSDHVWGDDTSSTSFGVNGVNVYGTLKASRSVNTTLICRGSLTYGNNVGGVLDYGSPGADEIPAAVTAKLLGNDALALAAGKHVLTSHNSTAATLMACGKPRTRNTRLVNAISAGATSIEVVNYAGWEIDDRIVLASDTNDATRAQVVTITGGSGPVWDVSPITLARPADCLVGNLSSNVVFGAASINNPTCVAYSIGGTTGVVGVCRVRDVRFENVGVTGVGWVSANNPNYYGALGLAPLGLCLASAHNCSTEATGSNTNCGGGPSIYLPSSARTWARRWACYAAVSGQLTYFGDSASGTIADSVGYRVQTAFNAGFGGGSASGEVVDCETWNVARNFSPLTTIGLKVIRGVHRTIGSNSILSNGQATFENAQIFGSAANTFTAAGAAGVAGVVTYRGCTFSPIEMLTSNNTTGNIPSQDSRNNLIAVNNVGTDNRVLSYYQTTVTDLTTRRRSTYAVKIQPKVANTPITYVFTIPAISGVAQVIKGSLRFDATYGTVTPPSIVLAGQGVSQSFTCAATADAWDDFSFSFSPTSTGDITATVTVQSTSTAGFAWLDGVWHYPMTQSVRHFGYQWLPQAAQVADSLITVSEATALAYPVTVDHGTDTITVTANATTADVWHACMADLVQTANQGEPQHITGGPAFTTSYDVAVATGATLTGTFTTTGTVSTAGSGLVNGVYTDSTGRHVRITATELLTGSRVQLYNLTDSTELLNTELTGAGLSHALTHSADKTIRLRVAKVGYLPIEATGVLSASGLSFLNSQVTDAVYVANGIDGSTCTEFAPDYPNLQIEVTDPDNVTSVQRIYAWTRWANWVAADGIRLMHNAVQAQDSANYSIDVTVVDAHFQNMNTDPLMVVGGYIKRSDGTTVIAAGGSIQMDPGRAYVAPGSGGGATAAEVWAYSTRTISNTPIVLEPGERIITRQSDGAFLARS